MSGDAGHTPGRVGQPLRAVRIRQGELNATVCVAVAGLVLVMLIDRSRTAPSPLALTIGAPGILLSWGLALLLWPRLRPGRRTPASFGATLALPGMMVGALAVAWGLFDLAIWWSDPPNPWYLPLTGAGAALGALGAILCLASMARLQKARVRTARDRD